jgi:outer membrane lipoprotein-sorting protein
MKNFKITILILFGFLVKVNAQTLTPMKDTTFFIREITEMNKALISLESDFTQEKLISVMSEKIISKGHFCFKKQNKILWEYTTPFTYRIVINNTNMWIQDNKKTKRYNMQSNKIFKTINDLMSSTVQGNVLGNKDYKARFMENSKYDVIELSPVQKETKEFVKVIQLFFDKKLHDVVKVKMTEPSEDYTIIDFTNRKRNINIGDEKFTVK